MSGSSIMMAVPFVAIVFSASAPAYSNCLAAARAGWFLSYPIEGVLKVAGASLLFAGHVVLCRGKKSLSRADKCYLGGVAALLSFFGGSLLKMAPPPALLCVTGLLFGANFGQAKWVARTNPANDRRTWVVAGAVNAALCGSAALAAAGAHAPTRALAAMVGSLCFLVASVSVLVALYRSPFDTVLGQCCKVSGSVCLVSANAYGFGWHLADAVHPGVLSTDLATAIYAADPRYAAVGLLYAVVLCVLLAGERIVPEPAPVPKKDKKA